MQTTRPSLLLRVRDRADADAWGEFVALYEPMLIRYATVRGLALHDAEDVAQHCLASISRKIRDFDYDPSRGRFRGWLKKMVNDRVFNIVRGRREKNLGSAALERSQEREEAPDDVWQRVWLEEHVRYCCEKISAEVQPHTYEAFRRVAIEEQSVKEVCQALGLTPNQVYVARSRITRRLRELMMSIYGEDV